MSDEAFLPPRRMTPAQASDIGRTYKALAEQFEAAGGEWYAARALRQSRWWLTYAACLAQTPIQDTK
jgi:hypothetical protein